jgi:phospholipid/cholesterol/gamma-HCH transport system substrate-binding protein
MRQNLVETLIGAVVLLVAAVFLVFAYGKSGVGHIAGYALTAKFSRVDGIAVGSQVRLAGIKVGTVTDQRLDPKDYRAVVIMSLDPSVQLPEDSAVKIASDGLLGGKYLSLEPGGAEQMLKAGQEIKFSQGSVDLIDLVGQYMFSNAGSSQSKDAPKPELK